jgi:hypothetical protein
MMVESLVRLTLFPLCIASVAACSGTRTTETASGSAGQIRAQSCVSPQLAATPGTATPDQTLQVNGEWFWDSCGDTVENGATSPSSPMHGLTVSFKQGSHTWILTKNVSAGGRTNGFSLSLKVPSQASSGPARIVVLGTSASAKIFVKQP